MIIGLTGADGFVGSHLRGRLTEQGYEVAAFEGDLLNDKDVANFYAKSPGLEAIIHLAGVAFGDNLENLLRANVLTTNNLLQAMPGSVKKVILASSIAVYGQPAEGASKETDPLLPNSLYGLSKVFAEETVDYYGRAKRFQAVALRFSPIYGPGNQKGVIYSFLKGIEEAGEITVNGDGSQKRNYLHVDDACAAIMAALGYAGSGVFNIASPKATSVNDIVEKLKARHQFTVSNRPMEATKDLLVDTALADRELGFRAQAVELQLD